MKLEGQFSPQALQRKKIMILAEVIQILHWPKKNKEFWQLVNGVCRFTEHEHFLQWKTSDFFKEFIEDVKTNFKIYSKDSKFWKNC